MQPPVDPAPPVDSRAGFAAAVRWALAAAAARGARRLTLVDPDFADWPLGEPEVLDTLAGWLRRPQRSLVLLAARYDELSRRHPRFVAWRRHWSHAIQAYAPPDELAAALPHWLFDDTGVCLQRQAGERWRGRGQVDDATQRAWAQEIDAVLQRSQPAFPVDTLGL